MEKSFLYWAPRIFCILAILFVMLFSLDVFDMDVSLGEKLLGFLMHNIPAFILAIFLAIAWKWELAGGIIFLSISLAGVMFTTNMFTTNYGSIVVAGPFLLAGGLFLLHYLKQKRNHK